MKKVLVLGGTGAMGVYLVPKLVERGYAVDVLSLDDVTSDTPLLSYIKGAGMDVAVSVLSALREVALASPDPKRKDLFRAGIRLGQDMIGTMSNTLIFAFTGGALATMLVFYSYGVQVQQLLSSDYLTVELAQGLCSTAAVVLTVPLAALVGSGAYSRKVK